MSAAIIASVFFKEGRRTKILPWIVHTCPYVSIRVWKYAKKNLTGNKKTIRSHNIHLLKKATPPP